MIFILGHREHNKQIAADLFTFAQDAGLMRSDTDPQIIELAVEVGDRVFQLAFEHNLRGDQRIIAEGIEVVTGYLERYATPAGNTGISRPTQDDPA
ncbi:hypothetical protein [Actinomadura alba]|uniref:Tetracyclin repressor SlmA-like C-terminal domain-containing protein n=1 Tax=Actinomadura alba TaxID=406431 RepID=A0ABR7LTE4_9ACTN|nr:hypothetical protein [Actinomadura alba]MBC6468107.1 hypothetical protein [Actinomadura alba]